MKILVLSNGTMILYKFRKELLAALRQRGHEIIILSPFDGFLHELEALGVSCVSVPLDRRGKNPLQDLKLIRKYCRTIRTEKPALILSYTIKPNLYGNIAARLHHVPIISTITGLGGGFIECGRLGNLLVRTLYRVSFNRRTRVAFQNRENYALLLRGKIVRSEQCFFLPGSGVNLDEFLPLPYPRGDAVRFLFVGRIMRAKGVAELLEAAARLKREFGEKVCVQMIGYFDGELKDRIDEEAAKGNIVYLGFQKDVRPFVGECGCVVLPSYREGMSNSLLESAAMARPLIASDVSGCREIVEDGFNGFLCKPRDAQSLYEAMRRFVLLEPDRKREMAAASREFVAKRFDRTLVVEEMLRQIGGLSVCAVG